MLFRSLGREHHAIAQAGVRGEDLAEQQFGIAKAAFAVEAIDVSGVEQRDPAVERGLDERGCLRHAAPREPPHAPRHRRHDNAALAQQAGGGNFANITHIAHRFQFSDSAVLLPCEMGCGQVAS